MYQRKNDGSDSGITTFFGNLRINTYLICKMDELGLDDLNEIESRLYSQVFHGNPDQIETNSNEPTVKNSGLHISGKKRNFRYFGSQLQSDLRPISVHISIDSAYETFTLDKSHEELGLRSINLNNLKSLAPFNLDFDNSTVEYEGYNVNESINSHTSENFDQHNLENTRTLSQNKNTHKHAMQDDSFRSRRKCKKLKKSNKKLSKKLNKKIIFISDESEDECSLKNTGTINVSDNDIKNASVDSCDDDIIYVPPPPVQVIDVDDVEAQTIEEKTISEESDLLANNSTNQTINIHSKHDVSNISEGTCNDFLDNSIGDDKTHSRFNFALHGSDFNTGLDCVETNTNVDFCETESSCSTNEQNKDFNHSAKTVFNEVEFPKDNIFSDKNLDNFSSFITPKRSIINVTDNLNISSKRIFPSKDLADTESSTSSTESDYEPSEKKKVSSKNLPTLSPMSTLPELSNTNSILKKLKEAKEIVSPIDITPNSKTTNLRQKTSKSKLLKKKNNLQKISIRVEYDNVQSKQSDNLGEEHKINGLIKKKKRRKKTTTSNEENIKEISGPISDDSPSVLNVSPNCESTEEDEQLFKKKKNSKSSKKYDKNDEVDASNIDNSFNDLSCKNDAAGRENVKNNQDNAEVIQENNDENSEDVIRDPSDINLFNNTFFEEMGGTSDFQQKEDDDIEIIEQTDRISDNIIVLDDMSDSDIEIIETSSENDAVSGSHNLKLANCETITTSKSANVSNPELISQDVENLENFDVKAIQSKQSDDPQKWLISYKDKSTYIVVGKRGPRCNRCRHFGHNSTKCPDKPHRPGCTLCGSTTHQEPRCPDKVCRQCGNFGDYSTSYCYLCFKYRHINCNLCNVPGHLSKYCPDLWRRYHLTTKEGPIIMPKEQVMRPRNQQWCSGCAQQGHLEHECNHTYYHREFPPTRPDVVTYIDILNEKNSTRMVPHIPQVPKPAMSNYLPLYRIPSLLTINTNPGSLTPNTINSNIIIQMPNLVHNPCIQQNVLSPDIIEHMRSNFQNSNLNSIDSGVIQGMSHNFRNTIIENINSTKFTDPSNYDMIKIQELFMSMPLAHVKSFVQKQVDELYTKTINHNPRVLRQKLFKYDNLSENTSEKNKKDRGYWFRSFNMYLFGLHNLNDGKLHMSFINNFVANKKNSLFDESKRRSLFNSYTYIFGPDKHRNINYYRLIKLMIDKGNVDKTGKPL